MKRTDLWAFLLSFYVYLLPIIGPHAGWMIIEVLFQRAPGEPDSVWRMAGWVATIAAQLLVFLALRICLRRRVLWFPALLTVPAAWAGLFYAFMVAIPTWRLVESDPS